jgi:hypothetical protein
MTTSHTPIGLWLAVGAAVVLAFGLVAVGAWRVGSGEGRARVVAGLTAWLAAFLALGVAGAFAAADDRPVPIIAIGIVLPVLVGLWLLRPGTAVSRFTDSIPLHSLIDVQLYRVVGGVFIVAWAIGRMPAIFALVAGLGDIAVGLAAPYVGARVERDPQGARRLAIGWNIAGITDLVVAVALGAATSPTPLWPPLLGHPNPLISRLPFVLIPVFLVPLSILLHVVALRRLGRIEAADSRARELAVPSRDAVSTAPAR